MINSHIHAALYFAKTSTKFKVFSTLVLVIIADFLFYNQSIGWSIGFFGFLLVGAVSLHNAVLLKSNIAELLVVLTLGQCLVQIDKLSFLSFILMVLGLISLSLMRRDDWQHDASIWLRLCMSSLMRFIGPLHKVITGYQRFLNQYTRSNVFLTVIRGWFLPIVLSSTFLYLFSNANPIVMNWFSGIDISGMFAGLSSWRFAFWVIMSSLMFAIIRPRLKFRIKRKRAPAYFKKSEKMSLTEWAFSKDAVRRSLIIFNLMFALQTMMDMNYLWGNSTLPDGVSYALYAHKGAYPLIVTALLAAIFVLVTQSAKKEISESKLITQLMYLWISQNILLVLSSIYRTFLYVEIYALTYWRIAAFIWMGLVACGLIWIILRGLLGKSNTWLINANVLTLLAVLYVTSFVNVGGMIAHYNVTHSKVMSGAGISLDVYYLQNIGSASIPALLEFEARTGGDVTSDLIRQLRNNMDDWRRWTYSEYRLLQSLESTQNE